MSGRSAVGPSLAILFSAALWGTLWIPLRQMHAADAGGRLVTTAGFLLPLLVLLPAALRRRASVARGGWPLALGGLLLASPIALYAEGLLRGQVARVLLLFYLTPVWSTLLARLLLGEPIAPRRLLTIALGLAGMAVIFGLGTRVPLPETTADWMGLGAGILWAFAMVQVQRTASLPSPDRVFALFVFLGPAFWAATLVPGREPAASPELTALVASAPWILAFGLVWMLPVIWLTIFGASRLDPGRVALFLMTEVVVGLTTAALLTDEPFGIRELAGAILIAGAGALEITGRPAAGSTPGATAA